MKKTLSMILAAVLVLSLAACGSKNAVPEDGMTYAEYAAAAIESEVTVYTYFQAAQSWWEKDGQGVATIYTQDKDGGYFLYECKVSEDDYKKLVPGTMIRVTGYKAEWAGEVEISDCSLQIYDTKNTYVAKAEDITSIYGTDALIEKQNKFITVKGLTVEAPATYKWDGSGTQGDDLYLKVNLNGTVYTMVVESYLCDKNSDTYKAVEALKAGDKIDIEGFLYWYNGAQPHITKVIAK
jgi:hypothetical protein